MKSESWVWNRKWNTRNGSENDVLDGPFRKLSRVMLVTSFGGQLNGKKR